jgi:hypothetical protein
MNSFDEINIFCIGEIMKNPEVVGSNLPEDKVKENFEIAKEKWLQMLNGQSLAEYEDAIKDHDIEKIKATNLNELLSNINVGAMFYSGLDSDAVLVSIAAGGDVPHIAAWDKTGYTPYIMGEPDDEYHPISRDLFMTLVKTKERIS